MPATFDDHHNEDENAADSQPSSDSECDSKEEAVAADKPNIATSKIPSSLLSKRTQKSRQYDAIIAEHFQLNCILCSATLSDFAAVRTHYRTEHHIKGYASCCGRKFTRRGVLVDHIQWHRNPTYFQCQLCTRSFKTRRWLELHTANHNASRERIFKCSICSKGFFKENVYKRHLLLHEEKKVPCTTCDKK